jgi:hypothetical protein
VEQLNSILLVGNKLARVLCWYMVDYSSAQHSSTASLFILFAGRTI